jgi:hypothetical protein
MLKALLFFTLLCHLNCYSNDTIPSAIQLYSGVSYYDNYNPRYMYQFGFHRLSAHKLPLVIGLEFNISNQKKTFELPPYGNYQVKNNLILVNYSIGFNSLRDKKFNIYWGLSLNHMFINSKLNSNNEDIKKMINADYDQEYTGVSFLLKPQYFLNKEISLYSRINIFKVPKVNPNLFVSLGLAYLINYK